MKEPTVVATLDMEGVESRPTTNLDKVWLALVKESNALDEELAPLLRKQRHIQDALEALSLASDY